MEKVTRESLERYLETSTLSDSQKDALRQEFVASDGDRQVLNKAITMNGRKSMTKVPTIIHK
jgi:hypothetical protein